MVRMSRKTGEYSRLETLLDFLNVLVGVSARFTDEEFEEKSLAVTTAMFKANLRPDRHGQIIKDFIEKYPNYFEVRHVLPGNSKKYMLSSDGIDYRTKLNRQWTTLNETLENIGQDILE